ncbi:MAG: hypothetical protein LIO53_02370 [Oscillospiraceae bacterium]|nr:hypothetical protein [Oscillospiraceae bacterium]
MRNFKIFLWIFIVFLIQTVILARAHIFGAAASAVMAYVVCVMILEDEFKNAVTISIICAAAMGALGGRSFVALTLFYVYSSIIVFALRKKPVYMGNFTKALLWTFALSAISEIIFFATDTMSLNTAMLLNNALPTAVINTVLAALIYPILKKTMYKEEKKKTLLIT